MKSKWRRARVGGGGVLVGRASRCGAEGDQLAELDCKTLYCKTYCKMLYCKVLVLPDVVLQAVVLQGMMVEVCLNPREASDGAAGAS
jgi:hypothetical protein